MLLSQTGALSGHRKVLKDVDLNSDQLSVPGKKPPGNVVLKSLAGVFVRYDCMSE